MTAPSCDDPRDRLVIVDHDRTSIEFHNKQAFYRALELLESQGRKFFIVER